MIFSLNEKGRVINTNINFPNLAKEPIYKDIAYAIEVRSNEEKHK